MSAYETWDECGSAVPIQPELNGMNLFDSPLPELTEMDLDNMDLSDGFFDGDFGTMNFDAYQTAGYEPLNAPNIGPADSGANAQLAACFDFNDPLLYPETDLTLGLDPMMDMFSFDLMAPAQFISSADTSPFSRLSDASAMTAATTPASPESGAAHHPFHCTTDGCAKTFRKESQLKQHQRVHKKSLVCPICRAEHQTEHKFAQVRDLERHLQARHPDVAERANVRSESRECPFPGCEHRGRRDNVSRHYESKHGGKLKWRKGVPSVV